MDLLLERIKACRLCENFLPHEPRPVVQLHRESKIIIVGQAPGRKVHESGIPWNDASGRSLRRWLDVDEAEFYNPELFSIVPMGFCYPGKAESGDLPPRRECAKTWHQPIFQKFAPEALILLIGQYAQRHYLKTKTVFNLTDTVRRFDQNLPYFFPLPHPSPRNQNWLKVNPWFEETVIPALQLEIKRRIK